jgi:hypothetical protein
VSAIEPGRKIESRVWKTSKVEEEQVRTLGPSGQVKPRTQGFCKSDRLKLLIGGRDAVYFLFFWGLC